MTPIVHLGPHSPLRGERCAPALCDDLLVMLAGCGIDLVEVARLRDELARDPEGLKRSLFTPREAADCGRLRDPARHFAARFAAKEAYLKAVGTGVPDAGIWREIEIVRGESGEPSLVLHGAAAAAREGSGGTVHLSLSQSATWAVAAVILES